MHKHYLSLFSPIPNTSFNKRKRQEIVSPSSNLDVNLSCLQFSMILLCTIKCHIKTKNINRAHILWALILSVNCLLVTVDDLKLAGTPLANCPVTCRSCWTAPILRYQGGWFWNVSFDWKQVVTLEQTSPRKFYLFELHDLICWAEHPVCPEPSFLIT